MRSILLLLIFLCAVSAAGAETLKIMTFNLRYASDTPPNAWPQRRPVMKACLDLAGADIIGTQEGVYRQLKEIHRDSPRYDWIGLGRDGGSRGEFMAIFYLRDRFETLEYDHFWLSDTPEVIASSTWGHSNRRMVTWVKFKDTRSGAAFYVANTHFDHQVQPAREKAAALLRARVEKFDQTLPIIVLGDFNAKAGANKAYDILTAEGYLADTWPAAKERRGELVATFHGFRPLEKRDDRIDWILGRGITALWTEIMTFEQGGQQPSDHFPVVAEIELGAR